MSTRVILSGLAGFAMIGVVLSCMLYTLWN